MIYFARERRMDMPYKFSAVLFDFDGTIADTGKGIFECLDYACESLGKPKLTEEKRRMFIGPPLFDSFTSLVGCNPEEAEFAIMKYREQYNRGSMLHLEFYEGIIDLFDELKNVGIKTAVCSSKPAPFVIKILEHYGLREKVSCISCPGKDGAKMSKEEMINGAVKELAVNKEDTLMVGDRKYDIEGAAAAGVKSAGVTYGYGTAEELIAAGADYIADDISDLRNIVFCK